MKLTLALLLFSTLSFAQEDIVIGAPISVEDDGTRQIVVRDSVKEESKVEPAEGAIVPAEAVINPADGQLKLEPVMKASEAPPVSAPVVEYAPVDTTPFFGARYVQFGFGYLNSKWEKADPSLDNGSLLTSLRVAADKTKNLQLGFSMEIMSDTSDQTVPDNIRVLQYRLFADYHRSLYNERIHWLGSLSLSVGDYSIRRLTKNAAGEEVNTKLHSGTIFGLIPGLGVRFYLVDRSSFDVMVEYHQYFSNPQRKISGLALAPRFSFEF